MISKYKLFLFPIILDYLHLSPPHLSSTLAQFLSLLLLLLINVSIPFLSVNSVLSFVSNFTYSFMLSLPFFCFWFPSSLFTKVPAPHPQSFKSRYPINTNSACQSEQVIPLSTQPPYVLSPRLETGPFTLIFFPLLHPLDPLNWPIYSFTYLFLTICHSRHIALGQCEYHAYVSPREFVKCRHRISRYGSQDTRYPLMIPISQFPLPV